MLIRFKMISTTFFSLMFSVIIVQFGLAFPADKVGTSDSKQDGEIASIPLHELLSTFKHTHHDTVDEHLLSMLIVASYGDSLYDLPVNLSAECSRTASAHMLMLGKLAFIEETWDVMLKSVDSVTRQLREQSELLEHPLELVCRQIVKSYAEDSTLSPLFEKAKKDAANFKNVSHRPPYFHKLLKADEIQLKLIEKSDIPELAKYVVLTLFHSLVLNSGYRKSMGLGPNIFAKSCRAVAKKEAFAESMQNIFEKTIKEVLPEVMANDRIQKFDKSIFSLEYPDDTWGRSVVKIFYGYIAKDPILKKEVDDTAADIGKKWNAKKEDLDFSKF